MIIGQIAKLTTGQHIGKSSMEIEMLRFVKFLVVLSLTMASITFIVAEIINGWKNILYDIVNAFLVIIIANVPSGLPPTVTSQLSMFTRRMAAHNLFMKRIDVIEALGATTVIASDKTGTLTMNKMTVTELWNNLEIIEGFPPRKTDASRTGELSAMFDAPITEMLTVMCVCNKAQFADDSVEKKANARLLQFSNAHRDIEQGVAQALIQSTKRTIIGQPSEAAMLRYCDQMFSVATVRERHTIVFEIPFNSKRKWHLQIAALSPLDGRRDTMLYKMMLKGAPEIVIRKCTGIALSDGDYVLDDRMKDSFRACYESFAMNGRRVIAFASKSFNGAPHQKFDSEADHFLLDDFTFNGMCAIMDPPREEAANAIAKCKTAGIKVFMVTGDHPTTAAAIARQIGLIGPPEQPITERNWDVCHGDEISNLSDKRWNELLGKDYIVFGRTTAEQKLVIVEQLQKRNEVVTMIGDGVSDAPALKRANVGVAMGVTGSDVAKQAADIVLMDDNFASIVKGIEQGRLLFDNLKKMILYTLPHLLPEIYPPLYNFIVGLPPGLTTLQILSIDLGTEMAPSISLAYEEPEQDIMTRPPRKRTTRLFSHSVLCYAYLFVGSFMTGSCTAAYLYVFWYNGIRLADLPYTAGTYWQENAPPFASNNRTFSADEQMKINAQATAGWYINMVFNQVFHLWICRTRRVSVFKHYFLHWHCISGVALEIALMCFFVYCPGVQTLLGASNPPPFVYVLPVANMTIILVVNELRKWLVRRYPNATITSCIKC